MNDMDVILRERQIHERDKAHDARHVIDSILDTLDMLVSRFVLGTKHAGELPPYAGEDAMRTAERLRDLSDRVRETAVDNCPGLSPRILAVAAE